MNRTATHSGKTGTHCTLSPLTRAAPATPLYDSPRFPTDNVVLKQAEPELSNRQIARRLNTNHMRVGRVLARSSTEVEQRGTGGTPGTPVPPVPGVPPGGDGFLMKRGKIEQLGDGRAVPAVHDCIHDSMGDSATEPSKQHENGHSRFTIPIEIVNRVLHNQRIRQTNRRCLAADDLA